MSQLSKTELDKLMSQTLSTAHSSLLTTIGNTPLIHLKKASALTGCNIYGKAEFLNPGGSIKDRAALAIIEDAEQKGLLTAGGLIVEGTAGNTGIGINLVANAKGYRTAIVIPNSQSQEKKDMLRMGGAELIEVDPAPYKNPNNYVRFAGRLAEERAKSDDKGVIWANQFDNTANMMGHYRNLGPEIWRDTEGQIDGFICAVGSGGTLAGVSKFLREQNKDIKIGLADPEGAALFEYYKNGTLASEGSSITEGIGQGRITENLKELQVDLPYRISDAEALPYLYDMITEESLILGGSSAINVAGAIKMAQEMGPGHNIVTILCDHGSRYQAKLFNPEFLRSKNLPVPHWLG